MNRTLVAAFAVGMVALSGALHASESVLDEAHFLQAAEDALKEGNEGVAVQLFQSAIVYAPSDPVPYLRLGEFYAKAGQNELAQRYFTIALDVQPAYPPALRGLALLDLARGDRAGAQAQHDILLHACGATCPETTQVEKALSGK
jgi:Flp pilus assembly protein TadD